MRRFLVFVMCLVCGSSLYAQTAQLQLEQSLPDSIVYYLPKFEQGRIVYKDGGFSAGTFNIATLDQSLRFISEDKSILSVSNISEVDRVTIGGMMFLRNGSSFIAVVDNIDDVLFGVTRKLEIDNSAKKGAFGMESQTASVTSIGRMQSQGVNVDFSANAKTRFKESAFIYYKRTALVATKKNFLRAFPSKKELIESYVAENKVDFTKYVQVKALFDYIKTH